MGLKTDYDPATNIPDLGGKVILVTGGTAGLGKQTILTLAKHAPARIYFTGRNTQSAEATIKTGKEISPSTEFSFISCDHNDLSTMQSAVQQFLAQSDRLDVVICNAAIQLGPAGLTKDGYERQFGINFLAHALLVKLFLPTIERTATECGDARIVMVTSKGFKMPPKDGIAFKDLQTTQENLGVLAKYNRYGQSKLAMVLFAKQVAKRYPNILSASVHPGVIHTGLVEDQPLSDRLFIKTATLGQVITLEQGAYTTCWAATTEKSKGIISGGIYEPVGKQVTETKFSASDALGDELWSWTMEHLQHFG